MDQKRPQLKARVEGNYGEFVLEPLAPGYGVTIGNPLRRILMSSIRGTAVTSVYIEDVLHEFSVIRGVKEDVIRLILNLKELVVKFHSEGTGPKTLTLRAEGPGVVRASDFEVPSDAEIVNPDLEIATLADDGKLVLEVRVDEGEGYVSSDKHPAKDRINAITVDSLFNPVTRVTYHVEDTRVGRRTDLDKLTLRIWTDGSTTPQQALDQAVEILQTELSVFDSLGELEQADTDGIEYTLTPEPVVVAEPNPQDDEEPRVSLDDLGLTTRVLHSLKEEGIDSVDALCALSDRELKKVPGIGDRSLDEIKHNLAKFDRALRS